MQGVNRTRAIATVSLLFVAGIATAVPIAAAELTQRCTNAEEGYSVGLPRGWYFNEAVQADGSDDIAACRFFSPSDFEIRPGSGVSDVAIAIGRQPTAPEAEGDATTVGGKPALVLETEATDDGFDPAGTRYYQYWIEMGEEWLVAATSDSPTWVGEYADNKVVLDAMMDTLTFGTPPGLPDTALGASTSAWTLAIGGVVVTIAAISAVRAARRRTA